MVQLSDAVISRSRKEHLYGVCNVIMPKGSMQRVYTWIDEDSSCYCTMRICMTCDMADYIDRINDSWSSEDGAPLGWAGVPLQLFALNQMDYKTIYWMKCRKKPMTVSEPP